MGSGGRKRGKHGLAQVLGNPIKIQDCLAEADLGNGASAQAELSLPVPVGWLAENCGPKIWLSNKPQGNGVKLRTTRAT